MTRKKGLCHTPLNLIFSQIYFQERQFLIIGSLELIFFNQICLTF